ncbi:hypothetical protein KC340_g37 [Hortaea werneckii]|nr:hypothetical protein KC340_g37 [Hortaea werneckii]
MAFARLFVGFATMLTSAFFQFLSSPMTAAKAVPPMTSAFDQAESKNPDVPASEAASGVLGSCRAIADRCLHACNYRNVRQE